MLSNKLKPQNLLKNQNLNEFSSSKTIIRSFGRIKSRKLSIHKNSLLDKLLPKYQISENLSNPSYITNLIEETELFKKYKTIANAPIYSARSNSKLPKFDRRSNLIEYITNLIEETELSKNTNLVNEPEFSSYETTQLETKFDQSSNLIRRNFLEIGFGFGDFLFAKAAQNPQMNFFGCEPHLNGIVNLLAKLAQQPLANIKISSIDIRILLTKFPDNFFDKIYILFPDPWPKTKHFKRRLITSKFLDEDLAAKLKNNGEIIIATDHDSYKTWILSHILRSKKFVWQANSKRDWQNFPLDWIETKYQKKAAAEGRKSIIIKIIKNSNEA